MTGSTPGPRLRLALAAAAATAVVVAALALTSPAPAVAAAQPAGCQATPTEPTAAGAYVRDPRGRFITISGPRACGTKAYGINNRGQVVGSYRTGSYQFGEGTVRSFVWQNGRLTTLDLGRLDRPGIEATVTDINDRGQMVGSSVEIASGRIHGFLRQPSGRITSIHHPNAGTSPIGAGTMATQSTNSGEIVGTYATNGTVQGFLRDRNGRFTTLRRPGAAATWVTGINDRGQIVGIYSTTGPEDLLASPRGFVLDLDRGRYTDLAVPGAAATNPNSISNRGQIAGGYIDTGGTIHGFVRDPRGAVTRIDHPDAMPTTNAIGINDRGQTSGQFDRAVQGTGSQQGQADTDETLPSILAEVRPPS
jgi:probable HAF family extracellular repeat protein/YD repeat-containing protein